MIQMNNMIMARKYNEIPRPESHDCIRRLNLSCTNNIATNHIVEIFTETFG